MLKLFVEEKETSHSYNDFDASTRSAKFSRKKSSMDAVSKNLSASTHNRRVGSRKKPTLPKAQSVLM